MEIQAINNCGECLKSETSPSPMAILPILDIFKSSGFPLLGFFPAD